MRATATRMTAAQFHAVPSVEPYRTQLVEGEIVVGEPKPIHALLQVRLAAAPSTPGRAARAAVSR